MAVARKSTRRVKRAGAITAVPFSIEDIAQRILIVRGRRVLLDTDLAAFYGESTKRLNPSFWKSNPFNSKKYSSRTPLIGRYSSPRPGSG